MSWKRATRAVTVGGDLSGTGSGADGIRTLPGGDLVVVDQGSVVVVDPATGVADRPEQTAGRALAARTSSTTDALTEDAPVEDDLERPTTALHRAGALWVVDGEFAGGPTADPGVVRLPLR